MPASDAHEVTCIGCCTADAFAATNEGAALLALREHLVEELDFERCTSVVLLKGDGLPRSTARVADRGGVQTVAVRLPFYGRVLVRGMWEALDQIMAQVNGDVVLAAGSEDGRRRPLVCTSTRGEKEIPCRASRTYRVGTSFQV